MVKYIFDARETLATDDENITVSFSTREKQGILMKIVNPDIDEYISLRLNNNGEISFFVVAASDLKIKIWRRYESGHSPLLPSHSFPPHLHYIPHHDGLRF